MISCTLKNQNNMDNVTSLFIGAALGFILGITISMSRRRPNHKADYKLDLIIKNQTNMANELDDLTTEVQETKGIMASAKVLIEGFADALAKAGTDPVKLKALRDDLNTGSEDLAAGIAANPLPGEVVTPPETPA